MVVIIYLCNIFFFFIPLILVPLSRSLPVVTQIRGHIAGLPPPSPLRHVPSYLSREEVSIFFPRRLASNCTYPRCWALSAVDPFFVFALLQIKSNLIVVGIELKDKQTLVIGQLLREFESPRVRTRTIFRGTFSCALFDLRKARERGLATLHEKSTISGW